MAVIKIENLKKHFGKTKALDGVTLAVEQGDVYGFIGPNGAGKTTTIRILLGILRKTSGNISLLGKDPFNDAVDIHRRIAYVPGDVSLWPNLTGGEIIDLLGRLHGGLHEDRRKNLLELFQLDPSKKSRTYSKGNRQKVALVAALACDAELYLLDEPTSGLDPLMEQVFQECVREIKKEGKTVFLSSHILSEVESLCDKMAIIRQGVIVDSGTLADMRHLTRTSITVRTDKPINELSIPGIHDMRQDGENWRFMADGNAIGQVMETLAPLGIQSIAAAPPSLEELFMRHYGNGEGGAQ